jgi:two-component system OmpR family sensor kinase
MTLRARVLLAMTLVAIVVLGGAFLTTQLAEQRLMDQVDNRLTGASAPLDRGFGPFGGFRPNPDDGGLPSQPGEQRPRGFNEFYVAVIRGKQQLFVLGRPNVSREALSPPVLDVGRALASAAHAHPRPYTVNARHGGLRYRVLVRAEPTTGNTFVLAAPLGSVDASTRELRNIAWTVALLVVAVLALVAWWVIRLGIRPLQRMATAAVTIADDDLTRRVPEAAKGTEAGDLSTAINNMLGRLEDSFAQRAETDARLRRFVGDASHELRTPVQTIRGYSELYAAGALADTDQLDDAMRRTGEESVRMAKLIDELLTLARLDQARPIEQLPVDLRTLADDAAADAVAIQPARPMTVEGEDGAVVTGDEHLLRQVFANVVGNALVHTPMTSAIRVTLTGDDDAVTVRVSDSGPGMDVDTASRAFERFVRADPARTREHGGTGLGLAIVQDAIRAHGGTVTLSSDLERGTVVQFRIPR